MKYLGLFRILKRLRDLEALTEILERVQDNQLEKTRGIETTIAAATTEAHEIRDQWNASLEAHAVKSIPCGRCSAQMDITIDREHGPRIVENGQQRVVVCAWCRAALKPRGWTLAKLELPAPVETPKEEETPA